MRILTLAALVVVLATPVRAQQAPNAPPPVATPGVRVAPPVAVEVTPMSSGPLRNVRFEILITDAGISRPTTKKVSLIVATGQEGQLRSSAEETRGDAAGATRGVPLNVDIVRPAVLDSGGVNVQIVVEYQPTSPGTVSTPARVRVRFTGVLANGRKMIVAETPDPTSDRTTTIEVTATLLP